MASRVGAPASTSQSLAPAKGGMIQFQSNGNILQK